jgi:predicted  nucleic acid-binding Zn-ribbon protein
VSLLISPGKTLKRQYDEVMGELETWKRKREARVQEHDAIQGQVNDIRESLGMTVTCTKKAKNSITRANMDFLKLELERMRGEKV